MAKDLVAILVNELHPRYKLVHLANTNAIYGLGALLESLVVVPHILICSSQWTLDQQSLIQGIANEMCPGIKTVAVPPGLSAVKGTTAAVGFVREEILSMGLSASN
ncbi:uncharacterized protein LY89DRAFT_681583 [Mollisia scopiformis]|uniref:Uncharacterized protein n=1 Tax=Mollisia scopiformis TaxID=149040 RepID=A0A194XLE4_MOLSC|nr:uncharacterized protein LY89DRAFT_681583 [Mollisia scopiformis]KUJ20951.1 hypothetical protein LY89DRAFT_681583 [Mollisia scopiformis]